jgi:SAM-dependent methyltransferase
MTEKKSVAPPHPPQKEPSYQGVCGVCGEEQIFYKKHRSIREGYQCRKCKASLRYQGQAEAIVQKFSHAPNISLEMLCTQAQFQKIAIYEPGVIGPFRKYFSEFPNYINSYYWDDVPPGEARDGIQCQNLEQLTYEADQFDLVLSSDIMEHVRHPWDAFKEIHRVLKPGGYHIFSIPVQHPMPSKTVYRVDTSGDEDIHLMEPRYHSAPRPGSNERGESLVYVDFGKDIVEHLEVIGFDVELLQLKNQDSEIQKLITFVTRKH